MKSLLNAQISQPLLGKLTLASWQLLDWLTPKRSDHWAFFTHPLKRTQFVENSRAVFEAVKDDASIHKLIFTRGAGVVLPLQGGCNVRVVNLQSLDGLCTLARCGVLLLTNSIAMDMVLRWADGSRNFPRPSLTRRTVINLWHGIPLKRLFALANAEQRQHGDRDVYRRKERTFYKGLVSSSDIDSYAMAAIFHPIDYQNVWITGLPRNDFLRMAESNLPDFLRDEVETIRRLKKNRRLIVYAPTYREAEIEGSECYQFDEREIACLKELLHRHNAVLGFRMHYFRNSDRLFNMERYVDGESIIDLGHATINEIAPVLRESDMVITDYSSVYIDAMYIDKPIFSFAYDLEHYQARQNGLLYEMELAFPGSVRRDFQELLSALEQELSCPQQVASAHYRITKKLFFNFQDDRNSTRVVERLKALTAKGQ